MSDHLERGLGELTQWRGPAPGLWERALEATTARPPRSPLRDLLHRPLGGIAAAAAVAMILLLSVAVMLPSLGRARSMRMPTPLASTPAVRGEATQGYSVSELEDKGPQIRQQMGSGEAISGAQQAPEVIQRHVVRKATLELETADVAAAVAKASHLVSEARGEYVQDSSISGEGKQARAQLTLRIAADRLGTALTELRKLGTMKLETSTGEDVTSQVVDLEARLRNEQRIETELLQLLESRKEAPLKEILELRESLSNVRQSIERLTGQRQHLSRLVSLATVLVIIRTGDARDEVKGGLGDYFLGNLAEAWRSGVALLADTVAWLVKVLVGGLIWWVLLVIAVSLAVRWHKRTLARGV